MRGSQKGEVRPVTYVTGTEGLEVQLYFFFYLGNIWEWAVNAMPTATLPLERSPAPILQEAGSSLRADMGGSENNVAATEFRTTDLQPVAIRYAGRHKSTVIPRLTSDPANEFFG